jgi:hypothetical protein
LLIATPFQAHCGITDSVKQFCGNNKDLLGFCVVASLPLDVWAYQRYKEDQKPTTFIMHEARKVLKTIKKSPLLENFEAVFNAENITTAIEKSVDTYYPGYRFPYLSCVYDLEKVETTVYNTTWSINRRLAQANPADQSYVEELTQLEKELTIFSNKSKTVLKMVKDHNHYSQEKNSRHQDEWEKHHHNYGLILDSDD